LCGGYDLLDRISLAYIFSFSHSDCVTKVLANAQNTPKTLSADNSNSSGGGQNGQVSISENRLATVESKTAVHAA
jgi:hypothetical protein